MTGYESNFWTSGVYNEGRRRWQWKVTDEEVTIARWDKDEPQLKYGEGQTIMLKKDSFNMVVQTSSTIQGAHYICEKKSVY